jgi:hypothetical protein
MARLSTTSMPTDEATSRRPWFISPARMQRAPARQRGKKPRARAISRG